MAKKGLKSLVFLFLLFIILRLPGLSLPYHQDEWKVAQEVVMGTTASSGLFHPPLTQILFQAGGALFGADHLRWLPFLFGLFSAVLLYAVIKRRAGVLAAHLSVFFYAISFYGIFASLMVDTDGAILPTFFLATVYAYDQARAAIGRARYAWWGITALFLLLGLLVKLSFVLVVGAVLLDFIVSDWRTRGRKRVLASLSLLLSLGVLFALALFVVRLVYPAFNLGGMITHAQSFMHVGGRNYLQVVVEGVKAVMYLSPLLLAPLLFLNKKFFLQGRIFALYLMLGVLFYFVIFDFSHGALDKYLTFLVMPLVALSGIILAGLFRAISVDKLKSSAVGALVLSLCVLILNFLPQVVLPLYPKTAWFSRATHLEWNMLTPFTGGSGPLGFYVSFLFIVVVFLISLGLIVFARFRPQWRQTLLISCLVLGLSYNLVFVEEFLFGAINGSAPVVLRQALAAIAVDQTKQPIITFNDSGAYELIQMDRYAGRFYAVPGYEPVHRKLFADFKGHYLVVGLPIFSPDSFYGEFFSRCTTLSEFQSKKVVGRIYSCPEVSS